VVGLFGMGKELYSFGTIPNELAGGSSIGAMLRDETVREEIVGEEVDLVLRRRSLLYMMP
jgi:hypothetical protein